MSSLPAASWPSHYSMRVMLHKMQTSLCPSELQGFILGLLCVLPYKTFAASVTYLESELCFPVREDGSPESLLVRQLFDSTYHSLLSENYEFALFLPAMDDPFTERLESVAGWCKGFLYGLGLYQGPDFSEMVKELIQDIAEIGKVEIDEGETEENEKALFELSEYLKVATLLIFAECNVGVTERTEDTVH